MRKLSLTITILVFVLKALAQSPHGTQLKIDCADCHTTGSWGFSKETSVFDHQKTTFLLEGQHQFTDCKSCHKSLVFNDAKTDCADCHTDMHSTTVGDDCASCHDPKSWIVENISELHQQSRFPLLGAHNSADCIACHKQALRLEFEPLGIECIDCHKASYYATTSPNHIQAGMSTNCIECHNMNAFEWSSSGFNHSFFPLTEGHAINCATCHEAGILAPISPECYSCHQADYESATNPLHLPSDFSTNCAECHTTSVDWQPARFEIHDALYFPVFSGAHRGEWDKCSDCHTQPETYSVFSCTNCHEHRQSKMDNEHKEEPNYVYNSINCLACHTAGDAD